MSKTRRKVPTKKVKWSGKAPDLSKVHAGTVTAMFEPMTLAKLLQHLAPNAQVHTHGDVTSSTEVEIVSVTVRQRSLGLALGSSSKRWDSIYSADRDDVIDLIPNSLESIDRIISSSSEQTNRKVRK